MVDPNMSTALTSAEKREIIESWAIIKKDIKKNAEELLIRFVTRYPEYHQLFKNFAHLPVDQLPGNKKLQGHANSIFYALSAVVENLDEPACLIDMLMRLGSFHHTHSVTEQGFQDLKAVYLEFIQEKLGPKLTVSGVEAWDKTMNVLFVVIFRGMRERIEDEEARASTSIT